ncbi:unnamed protein product [Absidia cylindrospora]
MPTTNLSHRHRPSTTSTSSSSSSSSSSTRPALPRVLTNSPSNAVHLSRSTARTSRRVRSHWISHFALNWRRSSRYSKFVFAYSLTLLALQVLATVVVLCFSWNMYCDKPLRIFLTVYVLRLAVSSPLSIYLHLAPRRQRRRRRQDERAERGENFVMTELQQATINAQQQQQPTLPIPIPTATHASSSTQNPITRPPPPVPPMVYPPPPPNSFSQSALMSWIDRSKSALDLFATLWFIIGNYMLFTSTTCSETAKPIYYLSLAVIIYGYLIITVPLLLCTAVIFCLPCVLVGMRLLHVEDGVDMGGASADDIDQIPVYRFRSNKPPPPPPPRRPHPQLHHHQHQEHSEPPPNKQQQTEGTSSVLDMIWIRLGWMESPSDEAQRAPAYYDELEIPNAQDQVCAICLSPYEEGDILCRLWCYHHFHKTCVSEWLVLNSRCPLCKRDCRRQKEQQQRSQLPNRLIGTHTMASANIITSPPESNDSINAMPAATTTSTSNSISTTTTATTTTRADSS